MPVSRLDATVDGRIEAFAERGLEAFNY